MKTIFALVLIMIYSVSALSGNSLARSLSADSLVEVYTHDQELDHDGIVDFSNHEHGHENHKHSHSHKHSADEAEHEHVHSHSKNVAQSDFSIIQQNLICYLSDSLAPKFSSYVVSRIQEPMLSSPFRPPIV